MTIALTRAFSKIEWGSLKRAVYARLREDRSTVRVRGLVDSEGVLLPPLPKPPPVESSSLSFSPSRERTSSFLRPVRLPVKIV